MNVAFTLNGRQVTEDVAPDQTLFAWLRAHHISSVKCGCETSNCPSGVGATNRALVIRA